MVLGLFTALASAFLGTVREATRKLASENFSSIELGLLTQIYGSIMLLPLASWRYTVTGFEPTKGLMLALTAAVMVVVSTTYLYIEAMRREQISLTEPLRKTTPVFVAVLEPLILGIKFNIKVAAGALLGTIGAYIVVSKDSVLEPLKNLKNPGAAMSVLVAVIFAIWALAQRFGATNTDPLIFTYLTYLGGLAGFTAWITVSDGRIQFSDLLRIEVFYMGVATAVSAVVGIYAYSLLTASEVTVIRQTSAIFGIIIGGRYFKEENLARKLAGSILILSGVAIVAL